MLRVLRNLAMVVVLAAGLALGLAWWMFHRALPQLDGTASVPHVRQEVIVDRDNWGVPYIRAHTAEDLFTVQGYVLAQDRLWQMDLLRRVAAGELSEVFGARTLPVDREFRTLGLRDVAEREAANIDPQMHAVLEAYARGVNRYIEECGSKLPWEFIYLGYKPRPWKPSDTLLVAGYIHRVLSSSWESELKRAQVTEQIGPERAKELYVVDFPLDHFLVGEAPAEKTSGPRKPPSHAPKVSISNAARGQPAAPQLWEAAQATLKEFEEELQAGSNNWVVDGTHTYSGKPLLANDTHLPLSVPCIWYIVHLAAPGWNVKGVTFPGVPGIVLGHNDRIAWGATNNGADVQDLYIEKFNPANPLEYRVNGQWVRAEVRRETIKVRGQPDETLEAFITRHGPVVHREAGRAYALRWTAIDPGALAGLSAGFFLLGRARNWAEFLNATRRITGPAQNLVFADVDGNIGYVLAAQIPVRKKGNGAVPVPGETDDYEWTGYIPFDELPLVLNPPGGVIVTANARVVGPGYPHFLTERWVAPYRTARIYELLAENKNLRPEDCVAIQADIVSLPHHFLAQQLARASQAAQPRDPRARALVDRLKGWSGAAAADSVEMAFVEFTRRALMRNLLRPRLGNNWRLYEWWRDSVFLESVLRERPPQWLPKEVHSYDELLMASADAAVQDLESQSRRAEISQWRWGRFIQLELAHPFGRVRWLPRLSIGPLDQSGAANTVKQTGRSFGPAKRFVADLSNFDNSLLNLTLGESGQYGSPHYRDQFRHWFEGRGIPSAFSDAAGERVRAHRLRLLPVRP